MDTATRSKVLHVEFGKHAGLYVSELSRMGKTWYTYGVILRPGHPYYELEYDEYGPTWEPDGMRFCCSPLTDYYDGLRIPYMGRWYADDSLGTTMAVEDCLAKAINLAEQLDVM